MHISYLQTLSIWTHHIVSAGKSCVSGGLHIRQCSLGELLMLVPSWKLWTSASLSVCTVRVIVPILLIPLGYFQGVGNQRTPCLSDHLFGEIRKTWLQNSMLWWVSIQQVCLAHSRMEHLTTISSGNQEPTKPSMKPWPNVLSTRMSFLPPLFDHPSLMPILSFTGVLHSLGYRIWGRAG